MIVLLCMLRSKYRRLLLFVCSNAVPLDADQQLHLEAEQDFLATLSDYEKKEYAYFKENVRLSSINRVRNGLCIP